VALNPLGFNVVGCQELRELRLGGMWYHVLNRGSRREMVFHEPGDYDAFVWTIIQARGRLTLDVLEYCLMPNHFHVVIRPRCDGDLGRWVRWLLMAHARRYHLHYQTSGHLWQGRFKAFPIRDDDHRLTVQRYVERDALRAEIVARAEDWKWSSLPRWAGRDPMLWQGEAGVGFKLCLARVNAPLSDGDRFCETSALPSSTAEKTERFVRPI
jgi:putative transposase